MVVSRKEQKNEDSKQWRANHIGYKKQWYINHRGYAIAYSIGYIKKKRIEFPDEAKVDRRKYEKKKRNNPRWRINKNMAINIYHSLKKDSKAGRHWEDIVGYSEENLRQHLEKQFHLGMTWGNYGTYWQIDHKIPIAAFNFERPEDIDFRKCWGLNNLQPLTTKENMKKRDNLENPFQPSLLI